MTAQEIAERVRRAQPSGLVWRGDGSSSLGGRARAFARPFCLGGGLAPDRFRGRTIGSVAILSRQRAGALDTFCSISEIGLKG